MTEESSRGPCTPSRSSQSQSAYSRSYTACGDYGDSFYDNDELELELNEDRDAALVEQMLTTVDGILYAQDPTSQQIAEKQMSMQIGSDDSSFLSDAPLRNPHRKPLQSYAAECLQWGQAFHHLRIEGKQLDANTSSTQLITSHVSSTRSRGSRSDKSNPTSPNKARFTTSPSISNRSLTVDPNSAASLQVQGTSAQIVQSVPSSSTSDSEEIFAIDGGGCEEMMAIDRTADDDEAMLFVQIEQERKRKSQQKREMPPVTPTRLKEYEEKQGKMESWWQSFAYPSIVAPLVQRVVDVLTNAAHVSQHVDNAPASLTVHKPLADEDEEVLFFDGDAPMPNPFSPKSPASLPRFQPSTLHAFDLLQLDHNGKLKAKKRPMRSGNRFRVGDSSSRSLLSDRSRASYRAPQSTILPADFDFGEDSMSDPLSYHSPSHHSAYSITQSSRRVEQNPLSRSNSRLTHRGALAMDPTSPPRFSESDSSDSEGENYVSAKESSRIAPLPPSALNPINPDQQRAIRTPNLGAAVMPVSPHQNPNSTPPPPLPSTAGKHVTVTTVPSKQQPSPFRPASRNSPASSTATRPQSSLQLTNRNLPSAIRSHQLNSYALVADAASTRTIAVDSNIHIAASISRTQSATYSRTPLVPQVLPLSLGQPALLPSTASTLAQTMPKRSAAPSIRLPSVASAVVQTSPMKSSHFASLAYSNSPSALHQRPHSVASIRSSSTAGVVAYPRAVLQALDGSHSMASRSSTAARKAEGISPALPLTLQVQNGHLRMAAAPISTSGTSVSPSTNGIARVPRAVSALPRSYQLSTPSLASDHQLLSNSHSLKKLHSLPIAGPILSTDIGNSRPQSVSTLHRSSASIDSPSSFSSSLGSSSAIVYDYVAATEVSQASRAARNNTTNHGKSTKISSSKPFGSTSTPTQRKFNRLTSVGPTDVSVHSAASTSLSHQNQHASKTRHAAVLPSGSRNINPASMLGSKHKLSVRVPASQLSMHNSMEHIPSQTVAH